LDLLSAVEISNVYYKPFLSSTGGLILDLCSEAAEGVAVSGDDMDTNEDVIILIRFSDISVINAIAMPSSMEALRSCHSVSTLLIPCHC
jgi:hypothetical protein